MIGWGYDTRSTGSFFGVWGDDKDQASRLKKLEQKDGKILSVWRYLPASELIMGSLSFRPVLYEIIKPYFINPSTWVFVSGHWYKVALEDSQWNWVSNGEFPKIGMHRWRIYSRLPCSFPRGSLKMQNISYCFSMQLTLAQLPFFFDGANFKYFSMHLLISAYFMHPVSKVSRPFHPSIQHFRALTWICGFQ